MLGVSEDDELRGIIPRAFRHINNIVSTSKDKKYLVQCSYLEIYNEDVHDLIAKDVKAKLDVKESPEKGVYVKALTQQVCKNV